MGVSQHTGNAVPKVMQISPAQLQKDYPTVGHMNSAFLQQIREPALADQSKLLER